MKVKELGLLNAIETNDTMLKIYVQYLKLINEIVYIFYEYNTKCLHIKC